MTVIFSFIALPSTRCHSFSTSSTTRCIKVDTPGGLFVIHFRNSDLQFCNDLPTIKERIYACRIPKMYGKRYGHPCLNMVALVFIASNSPANASRLLSHLKLNTHSLLKEKSHTASPSHMPRHRTSLLLPCEERSTPPSHSGREKPEKADTRHRCVRFLRCRSPIGLHNIFRICQDCCLYPLCSGLSSRTR